MRTLKRLWGILPDRRGQDMVEYALLAGFVALVAASSFPTTAKSIKMIFFLLAELLISAGGGSGGGPATGAPQP